MDEWINHFDFDFTERLRDKEWTDIYTHMLKKCKSNIDTLSKRIAELEDMDNTIKKQSKRASQKSKSKDLLFVVQEKGLEPS